LLPSNRLVLKIQRMLLLNKLLLTDKRMMLCHRRLGKK
jgi:hypothetical protein